MAVFVVDGDALDRHGLDRFDAVEVAHPVVVGKQCAAVLAQVLGGLEAVLAANVRIAALAAHAAGHRGQCAVARDMIGRADVELGAHHPVHAPLVVDEAARPELRQRQEARAADHAAFFVLALDGTAAAGGDPSHQRQAREVVTWQEALAGEVAVGVEVGVLRIARLQQHGVLAGCVAIAALGVLLLDVRGGVALDHLVGHVHLLARGIDHHAPTAEGSAEFGCGLLHGGGDVPIGEPAGRGQ